MTRCPQCNSTKVGVDGSTSYCEECGTVLEENSIVSELSYVEGSNGASSVVGQFVSSTSGKSSYRRGVPGFSRDSREATIENGRRRITQIAASLRLGSHHIEAAQRLFMLAVQHNFIQGRRTLHVIAACLYIVCRREKTPHMLIDFSDVLQTNVYVLGHTFLKFCQILNLQLPLIDPSLYIQRFAAKLEFEDKTTAVANTALRLVQRMRRDWIQTGRRPSGICGAALLIAGRLHGFRRTQKEIVSVVRVCDVTLRRRLLEFKSTPSGELTAEEFESIDLEEEADPPAFTKNRKNEKLQKAFQNHPDDEDLDSVTKDMDQALATEETLQTTVDAFKKMPEVQSKYIIREPKTFTNESGEIEESLSDIDDSELKEYFNNDAEAEAKSELWTELNRDYLEMKAEKEKLEAALDKSAPVRRKRKRDRKNGPAESAVDATAETLKKKVSERINYTVLKDLYETSNTDFDKDKNRSTTNPFDQDEDDYRPSRHVEESFDEDDD